jgi:NAD-dependent DNA ligase
MTNLTGDSMKINDQVIKEFYSFGYEDAKLGRKLTDADYFILTEAKKYVQNYFGALDILTDDKSKKLKSVKEILDVNSKAIQMWKKNKDNQKKLDEIDEAITILNNEIPNIEEDIDTLKRLLQVDRSVEIENLFGTLLYHYEKGYLTYKYEKEKDQKSLPEEINFSVLTKDIIDQYAKNLEFGIDKLD